MALNLCKGILSRLPAELLYEPNFCRWICEGHTELVREYLKDGGKLELDYRFDQRNISDTKEVLRWAIVPEEKRREYDVDYIEPYGYQFKDSVSYQIENPSPHDCYYDAMTAAIHSQNTEMAALVYENLQEIRWNRAMERETAQSGPRMTRYLLEKFPEILDHIHLSSICRWKNLPLLEAFLAAHEDLQDAMEELARYMEWRRRTGTWKTEDRCWSTRESSELVRFYQIMTQLHMSEAVVDGLRREIFNGAWHLKLIGKDMRSLVDCFYALDCGAQEDFTEEICAKWYHLDTQMRIFGQYKSRQLIRLDQYRAAEFLVQWNLQSGILSGDDLRQLMKWCRPAKCQAREDAITSLLLQQQELNSFRRAVYWGYIDGGNALYLYDCALKMEHADERILQLLLEVACEQGIDSYRG